MIFLGLKDLFIRRTCRSLVGFYGISTRLDFVMSNPFYESVLNMNLQIEFAQSAGAVEYTDCFSAER